MGRAAAIAYAREGADVAITQESVSCDTDTQMKLNNDKGFRGSRVVYIPDF